MLCERTAHYFVANTRLIPIYIFPIGQYSEDYFVSLENYLLSNRIAGYGSTKWINNGESSLDQYLDAINKCSEDKLLRGITVFWHLLLLAVDDEAYNNELGNVIDLAYNLHFTEPMIRDWCRAVEYVLDGNELKEGCGLQCETEEGREFFLHQK